MEDTSSPDYTARLTNKSQAPWKRILNVQAPYQWNLRRQHLGRTVDIGCGIGRNLRALAPGSVGVDHNQTSVEVARSSGLEAMTVDQWRTSDLRDSAAFDGLLVAHVIEHMTFDEATDLVVEYLPALRPGGRVFFICPQEKGYASDSTHVTWTTGQDLQRLATLAGLVPSKWKSFPAPRALGRIFTYNEFTLLARKP
ncbi:MAG: class SAM-dependent methyltransferase [Nocardioides sp.]|nr:class SAM-dependent methyltransferase [Nocardioides sp.]